MEKGTEDDEVVKDQMVPWYQRGDGLVSLWTFERSRTSTSQDVAGLAVRLGLRVWDQNLFVNIEDKEREEMDGPSLVSLSRCHVEVVAKV